MTASRHRSPATQVASLIAAMSILLAGCGIKSALEPPRAANLNTDPAVEAAPALAAQEKSKVQPGTRFTLLPPDNPVEWEKGRKEQRDKRAPKKPGDKSTVPDKPFILDSLL